MFLRCVLKKKKMCIEWFWYLKDISKNENTCIFNKTKKKKK